MRSRVPLVVSLLLNAALLACLAACHATPRLQHASASTFISRAESIGQINSAYWVTYIGASDSRAYLEYGDALGSFGNGATVVCWTELDGLPEELAATLRSGADPWQARDRRPENGPQRGAARPVTGR